VSVPLYVIVVGGPGQLLYWRFKEIAGTWSVLRRQVVTLGC